MEKAKLFFYGCGLSHKIDAKRGDIDLVINVTTPYCPITTDGKEPDLRPFDELIEAAVQRAMNKARRAVVRSSDDGERLTQKRIILDHLEEGIAKASGDGAYRFNQRQLFYVLRPFVLEALGVAPTWTNFCDIVTDYEAENGDIAGMFRDVRGTLYHPHAGHDIPLGTLAVEQYERPNWIFNKVLFIEKEGFFEALKAAQWPERHDCALMTGKGYATRAVRDLVDFLGDSDEPLTVFAAHDADAHGTMIYQTLQEATKARPRRRVEIVNLGLEPWEALAMGLLEEPVEKKSERKIAIADYVYDRPDGQDWVDWLEDNRVELNAMTTPDFIAWLDAKMAEHDSEKVIPPMAVTELEALDRLSAHLRAIITERVLREAQIDRLVKEAVEAVDLPDREALTLGLITWLAENPTRHWTDYVDAVARDLAEDV